MRRFRRIASDSNYNGPLIIGNIYNEDYDTTGGGIFSSHVSIISSVRAFPYYWKEVFDKPKLFKLL